MNVQEIRRTALDNYLKLLRLPVDGAIRLLPGDSTGVKTAARLVVDRADANIRGMIATVIGDSTLRADAQQRRIAADEREGALRLRVAAEETSERAEAILNHRQEQAARQREQANRRARRRREQAVRERTDKVERAASAERRRRDATREAAARAEKAIESRAPKERLDTLQKKSEALREKENALVASDEATRLEQAARRAKSERKRD